MSATTPSQLLLLRYFSLNLFLFDLTEHSFVEGGSPNVLMLRRPVGSSSKRHVYKKKRPRGCNAAGARERPAHFIFHCSVSLARKGTTILSPNGSSAETCHGSPPNGHP